MSNMADPTTPSYYMPTQTALLLLDFHSMFVQQMSGPGSQAAVQIAAEMRKWAKSKGIHIIHCLIDLSATPFSTCKDADRFAAIVAAMQSDGGKEPDALKEEDNGSGSGSDHTFVRRPGHVSALKSPGLNDFLHQEGIKSLILCGLSTSGCVMRTAIAAADDEYVVTVLSDGCADRDDAVHEMVTGKLLTNRGYVVTAAEFRKGFADNPDKQ